MQDLAAALTERQQQQLYRRRQTLGGAQDVEVQIEGHTFLSFCSNDYLGLANHPDIIEALKAGADRFGVGSGAAHLITGHSYAHQALEEELADFVGRPRALLFSTGYMANLGVISALTGRGDGVFEDRLNHASLLDAAVLSGARLIRYKHADGSAIQAKLDSTEVCERLIATDSIFSMDGDAAPLQHLQAVAVAHDSWLLADDAHGFGVMGPKGRGYCVEQLGTGADNLILMATLGKALGTSGAFVAGSVELIETLIQQARTYVYTTATSPALAWATRTALQLVREGDELRQRLSDNISYFKRAARQLGLPLMESVSAIQPLLVGDSGRAVRMSEILRSKGILVTAIRPPTVPKNTARLRITLCAKHSRQQLDRLLEALLLVFRDQMNAAG